MHNKLIELRKEKNYTVKYMADALNISKAYYSQIETGNRRLSYQMATMIAIVFDVTPDYIFYQDYKDNN